MVRQIIEAYPKERRQAAKDGSGVLYISECFTDSIQGEGRFIGHPATFLRMKDCTLNCIWCDTQEVWRQGNPYSVNELLKLWHNMGVIDNLRKGQHLVLTGGSPVRQQDVLVELIETIHNIFKFSPFIEIENECTLMPSPKLIILVDWWNNSPKLSNSGNVESIMFRPEVLQKLNEMANCNFKFVITNKDDWEEIKERFLDTNLIYKDKILLMPEGTTREELQQHYPIVLDIATKENISITDRLHITIFNKKTGV